jgi:hypothetical protein
MNKRAVLCVAVAAVIPLACGEWRAQGLAPRIVVEEQRPERVKAMLRDGGELIIEHPSIHADSLIGYSDKRAVGLSLNDVGRVAVQRGTFPWGPVAFGLVITGAIAAILIAGGDYSAF